MHPNQPFVFSVCDGLQDGFWPWAKTMLDRYPSTHDATFKPPCDQWEADSLQTQIGIELQKNHFSQPFRPDLLPGMYSMPIYGVPETLRSTNLCMVTGQSASQYSLNSMIP